EIQDQVYDEKQNTVTIKVVCCCPEKIKQKIICKAGDFIESIEIKVPEGPKQTNTTKPDKKPEKEKTKTPEEVKDKSTDKKPPELVPCGLGYPVMVYGLGPFRTCCKECYEGHPGGPCLYGQGVPGPFRTCCKECYAGRPGGPCVYGQGVPVPPVHQYDGCYYGGGSGDCVLVHYQESSYGSCLIM
ncbi:hypothetical protein PanWU01x14_314930, partial [Parasponia andersonii]